MKRLIITATVIGGLCIVGSALAHVPGRVNCGKLFTAAHTEATARDIYSGTKTITLAKLQRLGHMELCQVSISERTPVRAYSHKQASLHAARVASATQTASFGSSSLADVPGVPPVFAACVALWESSDGQASSNIYGMLSYQAGMSLAAQKAAFSALYRERHIEPWEPYDHCTLNGHTG